MTSRCAAVSLAAALCAAFPAAARAAATAKSVSFKTADGWTISALYHPARPGAETAVLIHGLGSSNNEWGGFSPKLWRLGLGTLAIDLRGHGRSLSGPRGAEGWRDFDQTGEWPKTVRDLLAAAVYLRRRGVPARRIVFIGASIGANLASEAAAKLKDSPWVVLLSPGEDYHGILPAGVSGRRVLLAASPPDPYAYGTCLEMAGRTKGAVFLPARDGHGVQMFRDARFTRALLAWIRGVSAGAPRRRP
ncbi:MAG: alpha/beta fold hydrolase [Elusimicrobia bacterium]|nr:alpha/beta fold hydrolase [Elusimicrobiota bacterium]MDE2314373.1 alpha/beta fold hydrolase [Elusimicrobiota bacterium]